MKIIHPIFQEPIVLEDDKVCVIQIENKKCYRELLCEILYQSKRLREGNLLITEEGKEFDLGKDIHVITDVLPVDSNQEKYLVSYTREWNQRHWKVIFIWKHSRFCLSFNDL